MIIEDPVCGMQIEETEAVGQSNHLGHIYYFCSTNCKSNFDTEPDDYTFQTEVLI